MNKNSIKTEQKGCMLELESLKIEYANQFHRSDKLDNKVYITITFFGFFFVFITGLLSGIGTLHIPSGRLETFLTVCYLLSCAAVLIFYVYLLIYFMRLLKPEHILRLDPIRMQSEKLEGLTDEEACKKLIRLYRNTINENLIKLSDRCDNFTKGLRFVVPTVILAFASYFFQLLLQILH